MCALAFQKCRVGSSTSLHKIQIRPDLNSMVMCVCAYIYGYCVYWHCLHHGESFMYFHGFCANIIGQMRLQVYIWQIAFVVLLLFSMYSFF